MKNIYIILGLLAVIMVISCKKEIVTIPSSLQNAQLLGKWYLVEVDVQTVTDSTSNTSAITSFTNQDYFEFRDDNSAVFSSSIYGNKYEGYYSANSTSSPSTLGFKSSNLQLKYNIQSINASEMIVYDSETIGGATVTNYYIFSRTL